VYPFATRRALYFSTLPSGVCLMVKTHLHQQVAYLAVDPQAPKFYSSPKLSSLPALPPSSFHLGSSLANFQLVGIDTKSRDATKL